MCIKSNMLFTIWRLSTWRGMSRPYNNSKWCKAQVHVHHARIHPLLLPKQQCSTCTLYLTIALAVRTCSAHFISGATSLQGPHQGAQKSTSTGTSACRHSTTATRLVSAKQRCWPTRSLHEKHTPMQLPLQPDHTKTASWCMHALACHTLSTSCSKSAVDSMSCTATIGLRRLLTVDGRYTDVGALGQAMVAVGRFHVV